MANLLCLEKKILLNYMTFNRTLSKDYVMDKIILPNNLQSDDRNLISFHNNNLRRFVISNISCIENSCLNLVNKTILFS